MALTNDGKLLLVGVPDGAVKVFNAANGKSLGSVKLSDVLNTERVSLSCVSLDSASTLLAVGTSQGIIVVINLEDDLNVMGIPHKGESGIVQSSFVGSSTQLAFADSFGAFWDVSGGFRGLEGSVNKAG